MAENTLDVTWTITEGEGELKDQTDTSVIFVPTALGRIVVEAASGEFSDDVSIYVNSLPSSVAHYLQDPVRVYPNPADRTLYADLGNLQGDPVRFTVLDV